MRIEGAASTPTVSPPRAVVTTVDTRPVAPVPAGTLTLATPDAAGRTFMSAASGLAAGGGSSAWAVSDEYGELARFDRIDEPGRLLPGVPRQPKKPDLEAIVRIPPLAAGDAHALLAIGSGSTRDRMQAVLQRVDEAGAPTAAPRTIDLAPLYARLDAQLPLQPNIEGAVWQQTTDGVQLLLLHRGKARGDVNTIFRLDGQQVLDALRTGAPLPADALLGAQTLDLGMLGGNRLGFADARALPDGRIAFVASAEGSDATGDGAITGSVIGLLDAQLAVVALRPLTGPPRKVEGIELARELDPAAPANRFVLVTDPDAPREPTERMTVDL